MLKTSMLCVFVVLLAVVVVGRLSKSAPDTTAQDRAMGSYLTELARTINAQLPEKLTDGTRLDTTRGGPGPLFSYVYTLPAYRSTEISGAGVYSAYVNSLRQNFCGASDMQPFVDSGILLLYIFHGRDGGEITRIFVSASDCRGLQPAPIIFSA